MANATLEGRRIGFIGCGAMARALAGGLVEAGIAPSQIAASDPFPEARSQFEKTIGGRTTEHNAEVVAASEIVILAVKPAAVASLLAALEDSICEKPLWISIAAGVTLAGLQSALPGGVRVVRTMPNTPALVGAGSTAYFPAASVTEADLNLVEGVLEAAGWCWRAPNEDLLDAVTGLSGSGPAYVFLMIEALADAGVREGLPRDAAQSLATRTVFGAAKLALETGTHPGVLKDQVASPGGTTIAGLEQLEAGGVRAALYSAVRAATDRSRALRDE
ncbi:MAG: pyrroline-5-carboxylate reductase [bacterium]|nr:pyrroline-5-carboxylate reductase [Deltaproteobacteria bacterium]MCP4903621.1 pyrroline-5-carboxylate reductase [bacterium]